MLLVSLYIEVKFIHMQGSRIGEDVPPPHRHCFITERTRHNSVETNSSRFSSRLREDLCMMIGLERALNWTIMYEHANHTNQFTNCLSNVKHSVEVIVEGLANITNTTVDFCESEELEEEGARSESESDGDSNNEATTYRSRQLNQLPGSNSFRINVSGLLCASYFMGYLSEYSEVIMLMSVHKNYYSNTQISLQSSSCDLQAMM